MRTKNKILILCFFIFLIGFVLYAPFLFNKIQIVQNKLLFNFDINSWIALALLGATIFVFFALFVNFTNNLRLSQKLFFLTVPLTLIFSGAVYFMSNINNFNNAGVDVVKVALNVEQTNYNNYIWSAILTIFYLIFLFVVFWSSCKPINRVEKAVERLGDGRVKNEIQIGGGKQFKEIEFGLNKINDNYKAKENLLRQTNLEYEKYIPKQFLKFLGKNNITELELGNQVQKTVTTMFCDVRNSTSLSATLSLEENFNYINSYTNTVAPIIRKFNGFIDKFLGDGILAVFSSGESAIECAHNIVKAIENKNSNKNTTSLDVGISLHTGDVIFGIIGENERKSPTIISDAVNFASKMEKINKLFGSKVIFSKSTLNNLPVNYPLAYRYIGSIPVDESNDLISVFESLETYEPKRRALLMNNRLDFEKAVRYFYAGKYQEARNLFNKVYKKEKHDKVCYLYYNKSEENISGGKAPLRI